MPASGMPSRLPTRIDQLVPSLASRDAIGNEALIMQAKLRRMGLESEVLVEWADKSLRSRTRPVSMAALRDVADRAFIYHHSTRSDILSLAPIGRCPIVVRYHNVTPPEYFDVGTESEPRFLTAMGRRQTPDWCAVATHAWADSAFNADELRRAGFAEPVVLPVMRDYAALGRHPDHVAWSRWLGDGRRTLLFVGRIVRNKAQHDLVMALDLCRRFVEPDARLLLIGHGADGRYGQRVAELAARLGLRVGRVDGDDRSAAAAGADVVLASRVSDSVLATCYRHAQAFLCLSEHEGFCVPVVEAMMLGLPVIAHRQAAVPETSAGAALLIDKADPVQLVGALRAVLGSDDVRGQLSRTGIEVGRKRYAVDVLEARFEALVQRLTTAH